MVIIFFNSIGDITHEANLIFEALGINNYMEGDSQNVLGGYYYSSSVFGIDVKLEMNSYDYEDKYKFMLSVGKDLVSSLKIEPSIEKSIVEVVLKLLYNNLDIQFVAESGNELLVVSEENISKILTS